MKLSESITNNISYSETKYDCKLRRIMNAEFLRNICNIKFYIW